MHGAINTVHILPFFPYSSDRGFSIIDYEEVDPRLGSWDDIDVLAAQFRLMFDGVFNHASSRSRWFQRFLNGHPGYEDFFVAFTHQGRDRPRLPAADPAAAHVRPADAVPHDQRHALRVDHVQPRPGRSQLPQPARAAARRRDSAVLRAARRRHRPARRRDLHLARTRHQLRAPARDARAGPAVPRDPRRGRAAGRADHRDQRPARRQHRLLRRRRRRGAAGLQLRAAAARAAHASTPARATRSRAGPRTLGADLRHRHLLQLPRRRTTASACSARAAS